MSNLVIYEKIRQYRISKGITQVWVAKRLGISPKTLNGIELGRQKLTTEMLEAICKKAFEVEPAIFFTDELLETKS
ncbi:helix-turn-helix domain-containing protein [Candidatus Desulfosporosinus nitrosoreducens]|uniref:helix-turn-helix domain-containing protein n=1 Tax=Candidatus Desulfosporosinus nitrosoreducens TaxID=3401928 RepID=UPI0035AB84D6